MIEAAILTVCLIALYADVPLGAQAALTIFAILLILPSLFAMRTGAPFVPTSKRTLGRMMTHARIKRGDRVYDLGCGDGRFVFAAADRGAIATGYELSIPAWIVAKIRSIRHPRSAIRFGNFWTKDFRDADVVFCYLLTRTMKTFRAKIWPQLKPGCRVVSHAFTMKDIKPALKDKDVVVYVK